MGGKSSQQKGKRFELSIANKLKELFNIKVRRTPLSGGMDFKGDIICIDDNSIISEFSFECKNQEKLNIWKALEQSRNDAPRGKTPLVVFTKNFQLDYCAIEFNDFINLLLELQEFRNQKNLQFCNKVDKNKVLSLLAEYHDKWISNVDALINDENIIAEDIVQDMYLKIHGSKDEVIKKAIQNNKPHIGYVNKILYTMYLKAQKQESLKTELKDNHTIETKEPELNKFNIEKKIDEIVNSFYWFDRKLFNLYRKEFHTIRSLSKATKISHVVVQNTISKCKKKIKRKLKNEI